jgi:alanine racemase
VTAQQQVFEAATATLAAAGIVSEVRHLANTAATLDRPDLRYDLVRPGLGLYGLSPLPGRDPAEFGLRPAMTLQADLATVKDVPAGHGVSYGHLYRTTTDTKLGIVPLGYADGIPRHASGGTAGPGGPVQAGRRICRVAGRVCMDQFVLDLGADTPLRPGDTVTLFGPGPGRIPGSQDDGNGDDGGGLPPAPTAEDWAQAAGTIAYEIVTRVGPRRPRRHEGVAELAAQAPGLPWTAVAA